MEKALSVRRTGSRCRPCIPALNRGDRRRVALRRVRTIGRCPWSPHVSPTAPVSQRFTSDDDALYSAKATGRNRVRQFRPANMDGAASR